VGKSVFQLKEKLQDLCREEIDKISGRGKVADIYELLDMINIKKEL